MSGFFPKRHKYHAQRTIVGEHSFASKAEATRYAELKMLERAGEIRDLVLQPRYDLIVAGQKICVYVADFAYTDRDGTPRIIDVKGVKTPVYALKRKLFHALNPGIRITEIVNGKEVDPEAPKVRRGKRKRKEIY